MQAHTLSALQKEHTLLDYTMTKRSLLPGSSQGCASWGEWGNGTFGILIWVVYVRHACCVTMVLLLRQI